MLGYKPWQPDIEWMLKSIPAKSVMMQCSEAGAVWLQLARDTSLGYESSLEFTMGSVLLRTLPGTAQHSKGIRRPVTSCIRAENLKTHWNIIPSLDASSYMSRDAYRKQQPTASIPHNHGVVHPSLALHCKWDRIAMHTLLVKQKQLV